MQPSFTFVSWYHFTCTLTMCSPLSLLFHGTTSPARSQCAVLFHFCCMVPLHLHAHNVQSSFTFVSWYHFTCTLTMCSPLSLLFHGTTSPARSQCAALFHFSQPSLLTTLFTYRFLVCEFLSGSVWYERILVTLIFFRVMLQFTTTADGIQL